MARRIMRRVRAILSGGAAVAPTTVNYTATQAATGFFGYFDDITSGSFRYWQGGMSQWSGYITGTDANMYCGAGGPTPFWVSIDGAAEVNPTLSGGKIVLFAGKPQGTYFVNVRGDPGYTPTFSNTSKGSANLLQVTGAPPIIQTMPSWNMVDASYPGYHSYPIATTGLSANTTPTTFVSGSASYPGGQTVFNAQCTEIFVCTGSGSANTAGVWYSVDGGTPVYVTNANFTWGGSPTGLHRWRRIQGLDGSAVHRYTVWDDFNPGAANILGVMVNGTFSAMSAPKYCDQWGDSITSYGIFTPAPHGHADLYKVTSALQIIGSSRGVAGKTTAQLLSDLPAAMGQYATPKQTALLAIGRNDTPGATFRGNYLSCINALLSAGYSKVLCRGIVPGAVANAALSADINTVVTTLADARVIYVPISTWTTIDSTDGTHPSALGSSQMAAYEVPAISGYF